MGFFDTILYPFKVAIAWLWIVSHDLCVALGSSESAGWIGGILIITVIVRVIVLPLALRSARSARAMSALQPEIKRIQDKYKGRTDPESKKQMNLEVSEVYGKYGANPLASCWPMLVQLPVLWALYRVLYEAKPIADGTWTKSSLGPLTQSVAQKIEDSTFFGAHLSESMTTASDPHVRVVAIVLVVAYVILMFVSMGWLAPKNMGSTNDQAARMMKIMGYTMPIMMAFVGVNLQIGVLIYWMVAMLFSLLQQLGILYWLPTPHSPAHAKMLARHQKKYDTFKAQRDKTYEAKLNQLGVADRDVADAQIRLARARGKSETALEDAKKDLGTAMVEAADVREAHHKELRDKRIALELEAAPPKERDPNKKTFMQKMMEASEKAEAQQKLNANMKAGTRDHAKQPRNLTKAQRKEQAAKRAKRRAEANAAGLSAEELEQRRQQRKRQARQNRKNKRK